MLEEATPAPEAARLAPPYQPKLFTTRELGRIVPIEFYQREAAPVRSSRPAAAAKARTQNLSELQQQAFDFPAAGTLTGTSPVTASQARTSQPRSAHSRTSQSRTSQAMLRIPVAVPLHRLIAGVLDASMVVAAIVLMAVTIHMFIGLGFLGQYWFPALAGASALVTFGYKLLWIWAETESPGLRWVQLRLVNFDGRSPNRRQRLQRFGWSGVSLMAGCLGLVWALVDEESLTWHDHSSGTFLTCFSTPAHR